MEAVGQLTGGLAHDFNNLLTVVLGNLQQLEAGLSGDERLNRFVVTARRAAWRGAELTNKLLAFSSNQPLLPSSIDLNRLIVDTTDLLRRSLSEVVDIDLVLASEPWPARVDPTQFESALLNLAINARDAIAEGGKIMVETANVSIDDEAARGLDIAPGDYVMLTVTDSGTGMPPAVVGRAFEPFYTTKEAGKGTGLGLSMVYAFVKQSGGHVHIESELGVGTSAILYLQRATQAEIGTRELAAHAREPRGSETILVVEDDTEVRAVATAMLGELGYNVVEAHDGPAALRDLEEFGHIDLLFTDVVLPGGMTGVELAREVEHRRPQIKVLLTTGYADEGNIGVHGVKWKGDVLSKPYRKADLAGRICTALNDGR